MPRKKEEGVENSAEIVEETTESTPIEEETQEEVVETQPTDEVSVYNGFVLVRKYSKAVHGENFVELAKQFISKNANYELRDR